MLGINSRQSIGGIDRAHEACQRGKANRTLAILLHWARSRPRKRARSIICLVESSVRSELQHQQMIAATSQPNLVSLRGFDLHKSTIAGFCIMGFSGAGQKLEVVVRSAEDLADASDQMAIGCERPSRKERLELSNNAVEAADEGRYLSRWAQRSDG